MFFQKCILFLLLILNNCLLGNGQTVLDDLLHIKKRYSLNKDQVNYNIKIIYFSKGNLFNPIDSSHGSYSFYGHKAFMHLEGIKRITNGEFEIYINDREKSIIVNKYKPNIEFSDLTTSFFDSIVKSLNVKIQTKINGRLTRAIFNFKEGPLDSVSIVYNNKSYLLDEVNVYYNKPLNEDYNFPPVIKIRYLNQQVMEKPDEKKYEFDDYLKIENMGISLKPKYRRYTIINNLKF